MKHAIDIAVHDRRWMDDIPDIESWTNSIIICVLEEHIQSHTEISIVLADNDFIQNLNKTYRNKDAPTNVLSFPQTEPDDLKTHAPLISLGDVIIAYETIRKEALEQDKTFKDHYTHMLVHGCLHLLHYDHDTDEQAEEMEALEIRILRDMDIKNPYEIL